jgi:hypothetical protein
MRLCVEHDLMDGALRERNILIFSSPEAALTEATGIVEDGSFRHVIFEADKTFRISWAASCTWPSTNSVMRS